MVKNTAAKGADLEHDLQKIFRLAGWEITRAAASHGTDLMAIKDGLNVVISAKWLRTYYRPHDRRDILKTAKKGKAIPLLAYKVYNKGKKTGIRCIEVVAGESNRAKGATLFLGSVSSYEKYTNQKELLNQFLEANS